MAISTASVSRIAARKHRCWWCGQSIDVGTRYDGWKYFDDRIVSVKVHVECHSAWNAASSACDGDYECLLGEHSRGCACPAGDCQCGCDPSVIDTDGQECE